MLFPNGDAVNDAVIINTEYKFYYTSNFRTPDDLIIQTANDSETGNLIMWRDSFGEFIYTFFAESFYEAEFRREIPYNFTNIGEKDVVIIEIVERNIPLLLENPPVIEATAMDVTAEEKRDVNPEITSKNVGGIYLLEAEIPSIPEDCTDIYFKLYNGEEYVTYEAFH